NNADNPSDPEQGSAQLLRLWIHDAA
ncbi:hypothetical protein P3T16_003512, partial [Paraburkholderia sp. GAS42]